MSAERPLSLDDSAVFNEIDAYQRLPPHERAAARTRLTSQFPAIAEDLDACLKGLDLVDDIGPALAAVLGNEPMEQPSATFESLDFSRELGDFRLFREIGRGGMGIVYEAEQISLGRRVALKVLPFAALLDPRHLQRFRKRRRRPSCGILIW